MIFEGFPRREFFVGKSLEPLSHQFNCGRRYGKGSGNRAGWCVSPDAVYIPLTWRLEQISLLSEGKGFSYNRLFFVIRFFDMGVLDYFVNFMLVGKADKLGMKRQTKNYRFHEIFRCYSVLLIRI